MLTRKRASSSKRVAAIARTAREIVIDQPAIALHEGQRDLLGLIGRERFDRRVDEDRLQFAEVLDLQRVADGKIEIGDAVIGFQHRGRGF